MIKAIETSYKGCRFRSRLEARYAVLFDHLGLEWEYEKECLELGWRLIFNSPTTFRYLPDFWLPKLNSFAEVKGQLNDDELFKLLNAAACISSPGGGCGQGPNVIVLGPITSVCRLPWILHMHKGTLCAEAYDFDGPRGCVCDRHVADDWGEDLKSVTSDCNLSRPLNESILQSPTPIFSGRLYEAFNAARSARFEFGQFGAYKGQ